MLNLLSLSNSDRQLAAARDVLARTAALPVQATANHELAVSVLEKALFLAAHYDQPEVVQTFVERFRQLLGAFQGTPAVQELDTLVAQCFRGLRKLGMRDRVELTRYAIEHGLDKE